VNTRFRPTPNNPPHVGSGWVAYKNYELARGTGGDFIVIIDDLTYKAQCLDLDSQSMETTREQWLDQLTWLLGEPPDELVTSSDFTEQHKAAWDKLGLREPMQRGMMRFTGDPVWTAEVNSHPETETTVHTWLVAARAVDDAAMHVGGFIRGMDLQRECELYAYLCDCLGYRQVRQKYIHTVTRAALPVGKKESKSEGAPTLAQLRATGYTPKQIIDTLEECERRSRLAGLEQNVLPVGVLEPSQVRVLESRVNVEAYRAQLAAAQGLPHEQDVAEAVRRRLEAEAQ
jgi:glutamyl/glutaminyl-tRNA synthetase